MLVKNLVRLRNSVPMSYIICKHTTNSIGYDWVDFLIGYHCCPDFRFFSEIPSGSGPQVTVVAISDFIVCP